MDELITLTESSGAPVKQGKRWLVTIARPGKGSTGTYSEAVLKESGPAAFPPKTKAFFTHDGKRDPRDMVGTYKDGAFWNDEEGELQAYLTPFPRYQQVLDEAGDAIEASIHSKARKDSKGFVKELVYDRSNTVDLVAFAGLEGSGLKQQVESLFAAAAADGEQVNEEENNKMDEKEFQAFVSEFRAFVATFGTFVAESKLAAQGVADDAAVEAAVEARVAEALSGIAEVEAAIDAADIPVKVKESLKVAARKGEDITDNLAGAVEIVAEAKKEFTPTLTDPKGKKSGTVVVVDESKDETPKNFRVGRWS